MVEMHPTDTPQQWLVEIACESPDGKHVRLAVLATEKQGGPVPFCQGVCGICHRPLDESNIWRHSLRLVDGKTWVVCAPCAATVN